MLEEGLTISYQIKQVYFSAKTPFQEVEVVDTVPYGRALITDRLMQSAENDEHVYHESLVQVDSSLSPLHHHRIARSAFHKRTAAQYCF
jgi:spermidine synthase